MNSKRGVNPLDSRPVSCASCRVWSERNFLRVHDERLRLRGFGLRRIGLLALGWPDHAVAGTIAALVIGCLGVPLGESVVPHPSTALRAALLVERERARGRGG